MNNKIDKTLEFVQMISLSQQDDTIPGKEIYDDVYKSVDRFSSYLLKDIDYDNIATRLSWQVLMSCTKTILTAHNIKSEGLDGREIITKCLIEYPKLLNELVFRNFHIVKSYL